VSPEGAPKPGGELTRSVALFTYLFFLTSFFLPVLFEDNTFARILVHDMWLIIIVATVLSYFGISISQLNFHRMAPTEYFFAIAIGILLIGVDMGFTWLSYSISPGEIQQYKEFVDSIRPENIAQIVVLGVELLVITAFLEELIFRGIIFGGFRNYGFWPAALLSSFLSAIFYYMVTFSIFMFLPVFVLGMVLCWGYEKTGNLTVVMLAHLVANILFLLQVTGVVEI
jgi:membrane protease YdiL (CAAX protease family)